MHQISEQLYGLKNPTTPTVFEALLDSIVEQQISLKVAQTIEVRLVKKFGDALTLDNETFYAYPTPQNIANVSIKRITRLRLKRAKSTVSPRSSPIDC